MNVFKTWNERILKKDFPLFAHFLTLGNVYESIVSEDLKAEKFPALCFCVCVISKIINWTASACNPIRHHITFSLDMSYECTAKGTSPGLSIINLRDLKNVPPPPTHFSSRSSSSPGALDGSERPRVISEAWRFYCAEFETRLWVVWLGSCSCWQNVGRNIKKVWER